MELVRTESPLSKVVYTPPNASSVRSCCLLKPNPQSVVALTRRAHTSRAGVSAHTYHLISLSLSLSLSVSLSLSD